MVPQTLVAAVLLAAAVLESGCSGRHPTTVAPRNASSMISSETAENSLTTSNAVQGPSTINGLPTCRGLVGKIVVTPVECITGTGKLHAEYDPAIGEPCGRGSQEWFALILVPDPGWVYGKTGSIWHLSLDKNITAVKIQREIGC